MARGNMVRFLTEINAAKSSDLKGFSVGGYQFRADLSTTEKYYFELQKHKGQENFIFPGLFNLNEKRAGKSDSFNNVATLKITCCRIQR